MKTATRESRIISGSPIRQTELVRLTENRDYRGSFTEVFVKQWGSVLDPAQWSVVKSEEGVFRGMHFHRRHDEYFCLISGHCFLGLKDMRIDSPTYLEHTVYELVEADLVALIFPPEVLHGWYFTQPSIHIQAGSEAYLDYNGDDNLGCQWNDPDLGIAWPFKEAILSERAQGFPTFKEFIASLQSC